MTRTLMFLFALPVMVSTNGFCQNIKIATVDIEYVYANLPSYKKLMAEIDSSSSRYQAVQKEKLAAYQQKLQAFQKLGKQTPDPVLKDKTTELETLQASMQEFQATQTATYGQNTQANFLTLSRLSERQSLNAQRNFK